MVLVKETALLGRLLALLALSLALPLAAPAAGHAAIEVTGLEVAASNGYPAGGRSDIKITTDYCNKATLKCDGSGQYANKLKTMTLELPPGLVGNPYAVPMCFESMPGNCPANTQIGTVRPWTVNNATDPATNSLGALPLYNMQPQPGQVGRFSTILSESTATVDSANGYSVRVTTNAVPIPNLKMARIETTLYGENPRFMQNPTTCLTQPLTVTANSDLDSTFTSETKTLTATSCNSLSFGPPTTVAAGGAGQTMRGSSTSMTIKATQSSDSARARLARFVMPSEIKPTIAGLAGHACAPDRVASGCPGIAPIGVATVNVPALGAPLSGPVYLVKVPGQLALDMTARLSGPISAEFTGRATFDGTRAVIDVTGIPDLPVDSIGIDLFGGSDGILAAVSNLCNGAGELTYSYRAHSGAGVSGASTVQVPGCNTHVSVASKTVTSAAGSAPLRLACSAGGGDCSGELTLTTGSGRLAKRIGGTRFTVTAGSTTAISTRLSKAAIRLLKKKRRLNAMATVTLGGGQRATATIKLKAPKVKKKKRKRSKRR